MPQTPESRDNAIMRLAHPLRCEAEPTMSFRLVQEMLGPKTWGNMVTAYARDNLTSELTTDLADNPENNGLRTLLNISNRMSGGTEVGNSQALLLYLRQAMHPQPYFVIDDKLVEMLEQTDIADDIPVSMLNLPYNRFYVEFGKERKSSLILPNIATGAHILEGCYVERGTNSIMGDGIYMLFTGSPLGKSGPMDDATHSIFLPITDQESTIRDALAWTFKMGKEMSIEHGLHETPDSFLAHGFEAVLFLTKVLLYIGLPEARRVVHKDKTDWLKSTSALKSAAKKAKAERRGRGLVDHVLICAAAHTPGQGTPAEGTRSVSSHWRRGHYRMQRHGPKNSLQRVILIAPTLVHGTTVHAPVPKYQVK